MQKLSPLYYFILENLAQSGKKFKVDTHCVPNFFFLTRVSKIKHISCLYKPFLEHLKSTYQGLHNNIAVLAWK